MLGEYADPKPCKPSRSERCHTRAKGKAHRNALSLVMGVDELHKILLSIGKKWAMLEIIAMIAILLLDLRLPRAPDFIPAGRIRPIPVFPSTLCEHFPIVKTAAGPHSCDLARIAALVYRERSGDETTTAKSRKRNVENNKRK